MREYGIRIKDQTKGSERDYTVFFLPLSYLDWSRFAGADAQLEPPVMRYVFSTYISRIVPAIGECPADAGELWQASDAVKERVIRAIFDESRFNDPGAYVTYVADRKKQALNLMGAYDYFLWSNVDLSTYLSLLDVDAERRAQVIAMVEMQTQVCVADRFDQAIKSGQPIDLSTPEDKLQKQKRVQERTGQKKMFREPKVEEAEGPIDYAQRIAAARSALAAEIETAKRNKDHKQKFFDWSADNARMRQFEHDPE